MSNESSVNSAKRLPVAMKADFGGVFLSLIADVRHAKFERGEDVPLAVRVSYDKDKKYFRTGMKMSSSKEYLSFVSARDSRPDRKEQLDYFNMILDVVKSIILSSKGRFTLERLQEEVAKGFKPVVNDTFTYWENLSAGKEKVKTRQMYDMALKRFREFRNGSTIQLPDVTTDLIGKFDKWLMKQKSGVVRKGEKPNKPLSLDTRMMILRALRAVLNQAKKDGLQFQSSRTSCTLGIVDAQTLYQSKMSSNYGTTGLLLIAVASSPPKVVPLVDGLCYIPSTALTLSIWPSWYGRAIVPLMRIILNLALFAQR